MIKGLERKMMLLKSTNSKYFDEAYLIMKDDISVYDEGEILREAERILFSAETCKRIKRSNKKRTFKSFLILVLGVLLGLSAGLLCAFFI